MKQKKIIIIGATSGIGKEIALLYLKRGDQIAITGRREQLLQQMKADHPQLIISAFDVMKDNNQDELQNLIDQLEGLDLLIYNSGFGDISKELDWEIENTTTKTNVNGLIEIVSFAFNYFTKQGYGQIAITSSIAALHGSSWAPAYNASKAFMSNYAEGLNIKAQKMEKDIIVTDIKPGFVDTKLAKGNKRFWLSTPQKAAAQIVHAIDHKKRRAYITKRWRLIAFILRWLPYSIYRRIG